MRVVFETIDDFLGDIESQINLLDGGDCVFQRAIRISKTSRPFGNDDHIRVIGLQCSAVVEVGDGGQYLMEVGVVCGKDYHTSDKEFSGSEKADEYKKQIKEFCSRLGLNSRPGLIEL